MNKKIFMGTLMVIGVIGLGWWWFGGKNVSEFFFEGKIHELPQTIRITTSNRQKKLLLSDQEEVAVLSKLLQKKYRGSATDNMGSIGGGLEIKAKFKNGDYAEGQIYFRRLDNLFWLLYYTQTRYNAGDQYCVIRCIMETDLPPTLLAKLKEVGFVLQGWK